MVFHHYIRVAGKAVMRRMVLMSNVAAPDLRRSGMIPTCHTYCLDLLRRLSSIHEFIGIYRDLYHFLRFLITGWMTITHVTGTNMRVYTVYNSIYIYTYTLYVYIYILIKRRESLYLVVPIFVRNVSTDPMTLSLP